MIGALLAGLSFFGFAKGVEAITALVISPMAAELGNMFGLMLSCLVLWYFIFRDTRRRQAP